MSRADGMRAAVNLVAPGAGLILLERVGLGVGLGLLFTAAATLALWGTLLVPDVVPGWLRAGAVALAAVSYVAVQAAAAQTLRGRQAAAAARGRHAALAAASAWLERGEAARGLAALEPLRDLAQHDLLVAVRLAQLHTALRHVEAGRAAWRQVRALDRHRLYRAEIRAGEAALGTGRAYEGGPAGPDHAGAAPGG